MTPDISKTNNNLDLFEIRPCFLYKEEYEDCKSIKAKFHNYFIHGQNPDCTQWKIDYENCLNYEKNNDPETYKKLVKSEEERRQLRFKAHFNNDTWKKRSVPPDDWAKPLPDWMNKRNENTFLEVKAKELKDGIVEIKESKNNFLCTIM